ncbi:hypothetical protein TGS27_3001 [Geobacillus stearothermophilus]|uniref:Uncharacterized protein n=1 Tax=Geobacillus stearothermophilus TaxID=1422 RepID=A0ABQ7HBM8_GEOSE|nr:hypothetical protein GS8_3111 [Geobacillus stearothermophilus]OAO76696.1 hypothetical protein TGS27_3001 [Geobacillus stearothermophilus]
MARAFVRVSFFAGRLHPAVSLETAGMASFGWKRNVGPRGFCRREADGFQRFEGGAA